MASVPPVYSLRRNHAHCLVCKIDPDLDFVRTLSSIHFFTFTVDGVCKKVKHSHYRPWKALRVQEVETRYPLYRRVGGSQGCCGHERKISPPPGFDLWTVQPVVTRYTDWAAYCVKGSLKKNRKISKFVMLPPSKVSFCTQIILQKPSVKQSNPITGLDRPIGFQEFEAPRLQDNRHMKVVSLSAVCTSRLYPPGIIPGTNFC
jgi:hypothetical protein